MSPQIPTVWRGNCDELGDSADGRGMAAVSLWVLKHHHHHLELAIALMLRRP